MFNGITIPENAKLRLVMCILVEEKTQNVLVL